MSINIGVIDEDEFDSYIKCLKELNTKEVQAGIFDDDIAEYAVANEYGCRIKVTPKMRKYLHAKGLHLRAKTKYITIPERSFFRSVLDDTKALDSAFSRVFSRTLKEKKCDTALKQLGTHTVRRLQKKILSGLKPKNHPFTVKQKGHGKTLQHTGGMEKGIKYVIT